MNTDEKTKAILSELQAAHGEAIAMAFDLPSEAALQRAHRLLAQIACTLEDLSTFEVAIGEDGTIEITGNPSSEFITIDISPTGRQLSMSVRSVATGEVVRSADESNEQEVVRQLERAA